MKKYFVLIARVHGWTVDRVFCDRYQALCHLNMLYDYGWEVRLEEREA